ncbi:helix-turn-helix domain-containing protein [Pseudorhodoferax sp.]|uniref:helix-turn-helix domain-containing protein n=1 Tax=Pseudorhodoferax sp. TaxID=1993553 RepID=UPI002DD62A2B|nr:helix-turn-helix domain-containing protein [Pseudorhodoferax sp.]
MNELISKRLKAARDRAGLTQAQLSEQLGFKDRQTLAAIEAGQRKLSAEELMKALQVLGIDLGFLTDPFRLVGEGKFSWRAAKNAGAGLLDAFEDQAGRWIALYRQLGQGGGAAATASPLQPRLPLTEKSSFEDARAAAEALGREWALGDVPAARLQQCLAERLGALVLYVDAPTFVSGAACQLPGLAVVLVNRNEPEGRRNYDVAHETFHLLTWEQMPPEHLEGEIPRGGKGKRVEQLADNFAGALLMPEHALVPLWGARGKCDIHTWLNDSASALQVTAVALKWRLVQLEWLTRADQLEIDDARLTANGRPKTQQTVPPRFSPAFAQRLHAGLAQGQLSVRRAAELLGLTIDQLADLFREHQLDVPFDL